jgi:hypothetical protein
MPKNDAEKQDQAQTFTALRNAHEQEWEKIQAA